MGESKAQRKERPVDHTSQWAKLFRDTTFGLFVRFATGDRVFKYDDEANPQYYIDKYSKEGVARRKAEHARSDSRSRSSEDTIAESDPREKNKSDDDEKDFSLVEFEERDPENPFNWSTPKKVFVTAMLCVLTFSIYSASSIISLGIISLQEDFGIAGVVASLTIAIFVFGYACGPLLFSPLSEVPVIGRNPVYIVTLLIFVILQVPSALTPTIGGLLVSRFLAGFFGSPALATGGATIGDMFHPRERATGISIWGLAAVCGPTAGPTIGAWAVYGLGSWRWTMYETLWLSGFALVVLFFCLPETSTPTLLYYKAKRLQKLTGNDDLKSQSMISQSQMTAKALAVDTLYRPIRLNLEPIVLVLDILLALCYFLLYATIEAVPLYLTELNFNIGLQGTFFLSTAIGVIVSWIGFEIWLVYYLYPVFDKHGMCTPEQRIIPGFVGAVMFPVGIFWLGFAAQEHNSWISFAFGLGFIGGGIFLLFQGVLVALGDMYPMYAASVLSGNDFLRSMAGGAAPLCVRQAIENTSYALVFSILGGVAALLLPAPFIIYFYGPQLRKRSKYAQS